jgi:hypothetical protein
LSPAGRSRLLKLLETANIKLASVATDVFGVSGWRMLEGSCGDPSHRRMIYNDLE